MIIKVKKKLTEFINQPDTKEGIVAIIKHLKDRASFQNKNNVQIAKEILLWLNNFENNNNNYMEKNKTWLNDLENSESIHFNTYPCVWFDFLRWNYFLKKTVKTYKISNTDVYYEFLYYYNKHNKKYLKSTVFNKIKELEEKGAFD